MILFPNGEVYYGQLRQFERHGIGKEIQVDGSYYEGEWFEDKK